MSVQATRIEPQHTSSSLRTIVKSNNFPILVQLVLTQEGWQWPNAIERILRVTKIQRVIARSCCGGGTRGCIFSSSSTLGSVSGNKSKVLAKSFSAFPGVVCELLEIISMANYLAWLHFCAYHPYKEMCNRVYARRFKRLVVRSWLLRVFWSSP